MQEFLNFLSEIFLGIRRLDIDAKISESKAEFRRAKTLADKRNLPSAIVAAEKILKSWYPSQSIIERIVYQIYAGDLLTQVETQWQRWGTQLKSAVDLTQQANAMLAKQTGIIPQRTALNGALKIYQDSYAKNEDYRVKQAIDRCQNLLYWEEQYQSLISQANILASQHNLKQAIATYQKAGQLFLTEEVEAAITKLSARLQEEEIFEQQWRQAYQLASEGQLQEAITCLQGALAEFDRADGRDFLEELRNAGRAIDHFNHGLNAEKRGEFFPALSSYQQAHRLLPNIGECAIRRASVALKLHKWDEVITTLTGVIGDQAAYLRGLAYANQKNWVQANQEWHAISAPNVQEQRVILGELFQRDKLEQMQRIEQLVETENLEEAKALTTEFNERFKANPIVLGNLADHIQPRLEATVWQSHNWQQIAVEAEKTWRERRDMVGLHNWAIATYYQAKNDPNHLVDLIMALPSAIANIHQDVAVQNLPWLEGTAVDLKALASDIQKMLADSLDAIKNHNLNDYLRLQDIYRREMVALNLMGNPPTSGVKIENLWLTPGCCSRGNFLVNLAAIPNRILQALYTDWGLAVAACIEGDIARAIQIKPARTSATASDRFGQQFVFYHEGCYYLQQKQWRQAVSPLQQATTEIKTNPKWQQEIDRLCQQQRRAITQDKEHLDFGQFWYDLLGSQPSRTYLAEYKAEQVREKLVAEKITESKALQELEAIKQIDAANPVVNDLIERIEFTQEGEKIDKLLKQNKLEEAVQQAKKSRHPRIRRVVAELFLKIFLEGFRSRDFNLDDMAKLGNWAYELCPNDSDVQEIYELSQKFNKVHDLMKWNNFDQAVRYAKYSNCDPLKNYLADFFILKLINGLETRQIPFDVIRQLARWAYELCPNRPEYQKIYQDLGIWHF
ncbi:hypothetical protein [[Phormidium] sp. ETS-05]|uniref:hypothetical protein n=1 Tax=[Phormidium] sp. ETS-05 TaxID=222819 RepID=UPI0018EF024E|nr:hypothetical protein [[Phormidium] sp. ETS-05]